jgi:hypothetical protein
MLLSGSRMRTLNPCGPQHRSPKGRPESRALVYVPASLSADGAPTCVTPQPGYRPALHWVVASDA